jgi:hypothetical protein
MMPLEFESLSHGKITFGFFNIQTDMILLNQYFLFAKDFCQSISGVAARDRNENDETSWGIYLIERREDIGNLMGAIHGIDYRGFIGEVYRLFPFPENRDGFKQNPDGFRNRSLIEEQIQKYARRVEIYLRMDKKSDQIKIGEYAFSRVSFWELIQYIWLGGYPRWRDGIRPDYVLAMKAKIDRSKSWLFDRFILQ